MSLIDWAILITSLIVIVVYGVYKSRAAHTTESFLRGSRELPWSTIGFSIMATQASAITFLSLPGQAYDDGMRFIQIYLGLPVAMVILCVTFVPMFHKMGFYTAYEYLEHRFDSKTRSLGAIIFLLQRGLSTSLTIYAPALVLSAILGWDTIITNTIIGISVIIYTVSGGTSAVSYTQKQQMSIVLITLVVVLIIIFYKLPSHVSFGDAVYLAGSMNKLNLIDLNFDLTNKYNIWSGLIGGLFLSLSYFGTDHSQVSRYLTGSSVKESRLGLVMNGLVKIPMQFFILFIGVMVFVFYMFNRPPLFSNPIEVSKIEKSVYKKEYNEAKNKFDQNFDTRLKITNELLEVKKTGNAIELNKTLHQLKIADKELHNSKISATKLMLKNDPKANNKDTNYMFLAFVIKYLPVGMIGLLLAIIFAASMSSTASALSSLTSVCIIDIYKKSFRRNADDKHYLFASRMFTVFWGLFAIFFAEIAGRIGNLIEAVNILGSLFYGVILGLFLVGFYIKTIRGNAVFIAAIVTEGVIFYCYEYTKIPFLWYNVIGCVLVIIIGYVVEYINRSLIHKISE